MKEKNINNKAKHHEIANKSKPDKIINMDKNKIKDNNNNKLIQLIENQKKNINKPIITSKEFKSFELEKQLRDVSPILIQKNKN